MTDMTAAQKRAWDYVDKTLIDGQWKHLQDNATNPFAKRSIVELIEGQLRQLYGNAVADKFYNSAASKAYGDLSKLNVDAAGLHKLVSDAVGDAKPLSGDANPMVNAEKDTANPSSSLPRGESANSHGDEVFNAEPAYGGRRWWLPSSDHLAKNGVSAENNEQLDKRDDALRGSDAAYFHVALTDEAVARQVKVWHQTDAHVPVAGTDTNGSNISTLGGAWNAVKTGMGAVAPLIEQLDGLLKKPNAQLTEKQYERLQPSLTAVRKVLECQQPVLQQINLSGTNANDAWQALRGENLIIRRALTNLVVSEMQRYGNDSQNAGHTGDIATVDADLSQLPGVNVSAMNYPAMRVDMAADVIKKIDIPTVPIIDKVIVDASGKREQEQPGNTQTVPVTTPNPVGTPAFTPSSPGTTTPGTTTPGSKNDAIQDLMKSLANSGTQAAQQASQIPQQLGQQAQQAAQPLTNAAQQAADKPDTNSELQKLLNSWKQDSNAANAADARNAASPAQLSAADSDRSAATEKPLEHPATAATPAALGAPGTDARPNQLDAKGHPADKDHNGKVDKDAVPLSKKTVKPFDLRLTGVGPEHQQQLVHGVPDPRIGEMMLNLAGATEAHPMSVLDAAHASGLDISSLGNPMDAGLAKVGDAVVGAATSGIYLGDGLVLTATGAVESIDDVLAGDGFVSEIPLPDLPEDADSIVANAQHLPPGPDAPVLPDTAGPAQAVPAPPEASHVVTPPDAPQPPSGPPPAPVAPVADAVPAPPPAPAVSPAADVVPASRDGSADQKLPTAQPFSGHAVG
ncbi:MAG: hypothetical protein H6523_13070 [Mycolicibacterium sp.]|nr:hypothetical protein [Mycolicibacterium sp.]